MANCCVFHRSALEKTSHHVFLSLPSLCLFVFSSPSLQQPNYWSFKVSSNTVFVSRHKSVPPCGFVSNRITVHCVCARLLHFPPSRSATVTHFNICTSRVLYRRCLGWKSADRRANHWSAVILNVKLGFRTLEELPQQLLGAR